MTCLVEDAGGARWILRRPPVGRLLATAHDVAREHRVLSALGPTDVPTPAVLGFTDDPAVTDAPLLLMEFVDGVVLDDAEVAEQLGPLARAHLSLSLVRALARVHAVDLHATGLEDLASHKPYAARQLTRWRRQWEASRTRELPAVERLADRLAAAMPEQRELTLVHGDFHLLNVIARPTATRSARSSTGSCARSATRWPTSAGCSPTGRGWATWQSGRSPYAPCRASRRRRSWRSCTPR